MVSAVSCVPHCPGVTPSPPSSTTSPQSFLPKPRSSRALPSQPLCPQSTSIFRSAGIFVFLLLPVVTWQVLLACSLAQFCRPCWFNTPSPPIHMLLVVVFCPSCPLGMPLIAKFTTVSHSLKILQLPLNSWRGSSAWVVPWGYGPPTHLSTLSWTPGLCSVLVSFWAMPCHSQLPHLPFLGAVPCVSDPVCSPASFCIPSSHPLWSSW